MTPRCPVCNWTLLDDGRCGMCLFDEAVANVNKVADALYETAREARGTIKELTEAAKAGRLS